MKINENQRKSGKNHSIDHDCEPWHAKTTVFTMIWSSGLQKRQYLQ
jgi:hypothetical protein